MPPRLFTDLPLQPGLTLQLPPGAARHVQVLRLQPGAEVTLFNGLGGEWRAAVVRMGRSEVEVTVQAHDPVEREIASRVTLALGVPANERMDTLVEKAAELGAHRIQPLVCERSVLRLAGERAARKQAHWQAVAVAACEQCGRNRVPVVAPMQGLAAWLASLDAGPSTRWLLSLGDSRPWAERIEQASADITLLSGPEGGLAPAEESLARGRDFLPTTLGPATLRADTAPLAALAAIALHTGVVSRAHR
jgi:16S rRNA (uracil1498-N3)-methyltransferase